MSIIEVLVVSKAKKFVVYAQLYRQSAHIPHRGTERNAFPRLWFESILIIKKNICYILGEEPILQ